MRLNWTAWIALAAILLPASIAWAEEKPAQEKPAQEKPAEETPAEPELVEVKVLRAIPFSQGSEVADKIRGECQLQTKVPHFLDQYSKRVTLVDGDPGTAGRVLELFIEEVHAPGGGAWSGPKWMAVAGTLREDGRKVAQFTVKRLSGGGMFAGSKGTCSIVGRCAKAIGKDIATWLEKPKDGARLGDG
jgi:hypothetical protein